jgi:hypothetical protein
MKCPKCGYHSFDYLDNCRKCGQDLNGHKTKFNLHGFFSPNQPAEGTAETVPTEEFVTASEKDISDTDFGFDFLDDDQASEDTTEVDFTGLDLGADEEGLDIDLPFEIDGQSVPAEKFFDQAGKDKKSNFDL